METKMIKVSLLQMCSVIGNVQQNCEKVQSIVEKSFPANSDVLVLPEVWTVGWMCREFISSAQELNKSTVLEFLRSLAVKYNTNIIGGSFISKIDDNYYNTCPVINRKGELVAIYNKNHLYSYYGCDEGKYITAGENPVMVELDGVNYGLSICYDIRFAELYRAYAKSGADILVNCAAWGSNKSVAWEVMTKSRAVENQCFMLALTQCGHIAGNEYNLGESRIISYNGEELSSICGGEGIACADIDLNEMYEFRKKCAILKDIKDNYEVKVLCAK